jgi:hypothetical protein
MRRIGTTDRLRAVSRSDPSMELFERLLIRATVGSISTGLLRWSDERETDDELRTPAGLGLDVDRSAERIYHLPHDEKSHPEPPIMS